MNLKNLTPGSTIERRMMFEVVKVNRKSIVISDERGNKETIRERDYNKYNALTSEAEGTAKANGRFPVWADTQGKRDFVAQARRTETPAGEGDYRAYQEFRRTRN